MVEVQMKYSDLRPFDTVVWRPVVGRAKRWLLTVFAVSSFTEAAVFLGQLAPGAAAWLVPGKTSRVCAIPYEATDSAPEVYVVRPRGASKRVLHAEVVEHALEMAAESPGPNGRCVSVDKWSNFVMWLPFKVDSALHLWSRGLAGFEDKIGKFDSFEELVASGCAEEIGRSEVDKHGEGVGVEGDRVAEGQAATGSVPEPAVEDVSVLYPFEQDDSPAS